MAKNTVYYAFSLPLVRTIAACRRPHRRRAILLTNVEQELGAAWAAILGDQAGLYRL
jgi:hypothetical protein